MDIGQKMLPFLLLENVIFLVGVGNYGLFVFELFFGALEGHEHGALGVGVLVGEVGGLFLDVDEVVLLGLVQLLLF